MLTASAWGSDGVGCSGSWVARLSMYHDRVPWALGLYRSRYVGA